MRKHTTAALREGHRVVVVDNVVGVSDSASLAAAITTPACADRILGKTESATLPNRTMILLSGNNLCLSGDMPRRVLVCRIDPQTDRPYAREFALNPKRFCLANRQALVAAALTLIRSYLASGAGRLGAGRMASFEDWDDWVRQTILYVDRELAPGQFGDVMNLVTAAQSGDPEQESLGNLLVALQGKFSDQSFTAGDVAAAHAAAVRGSGFGAGADPADKVLADVLCDFQRGRDPLSARTPGRILKNGKDRIVGGLRLTGWMDNCTNAMRWCVATVGAVVKKAPWMHFCSVSDLGDAQPG